MDLDIDGLDAAARRVRAAVSRDRKDPAPLRCILVDPVDSGVRVVATDRHRLAVAECAGSVGGRVLLDPDTLEPAADIAEEFPDYERFLAADAHAASATVAASELLDAIEAALDDDAPLAVQVTEGEVRLGDAATPPTLHLVADYLHDAVEAAGDADVVLEASGARAPLTVRAPGILTIVMPVLVAERKAKRR
jgi:DNA polymerase III sliding clamp (beta) subunit (PCNA family)